MFRLRWAFSDAMFVLIVWGMVATPQDSTTTGGWTGDQKRAAIHSGRLPLSIPASGFGLCGSSGIGVHCENPATNQNL